MMIIGCDFHPTWPTSELVRFGRSRIPRGAECSHRRIMVEVVAESMIGGTIFHR
jgi:hypothetical protein